MRYALSVSTEPGSEPLTTAEAKLHLRVTHASEDTYIDALVKAARRYVEQITGRAVITQKLDMAVDAFCTPLYLPMAPVTAIDHVKYVDDGGVLQTLDPSQYQVDMSFVPGRINPAYGLSWPSTRAQAGAVQVRFTAGYANAGAVPEDIKVAIKLLVGHWYENREDSISGTIIAKIPTGVDSLLGSYRVWVP